MLKKTTHSIILLLLLLTPIININEILWAIGLDERIVDGLFMVKSIKDVAFLLIILLSLLRIIYTKQVPKGYLALPLFFIFISICILVSIGNSSMMHILAGLRWSLPLFLFIFLYDSIDRQFMKNVCNIVFVLLLLNTICQVVELFYMPPFHGQTYFGLSGRTPGMFSYPNSCASFICLSYIIVNEFAKNETIKIFGRILAIFGVILAMSSTGIICLFTMMYFQIIRKQRNYLFLIIVVPIIVLFTYEFADILTNRSEGASAFSMNTRRELFMNGLYSAGIISNTFGYATNTAIMMLDRYFWADAFYTSFLINMGILPFLFMVFFILCIGFIAVIKRKALLIDIIIVYGLFAFSTIITEVFPMNLFLAVFIAYMCGVRRKKYQQNIVLNYGK
jgi:hypothetical protein